MLFSSNVKIKYVFKRRGSSIVVSLAFFAKSLERVSSVVLIREHLNMIPEPFL